MKMAEQDGNGRVTLLEQRLADANATTANLQRDLVVVEKRLRVNESDLKRAHDQGSHIQEEYAQKLAQMDLDVKTQLATKASNNDLKSVDARVNTVKSDLDRTKDDLNMARSELGTLIARNHEEIDVLRRMGKRDYFEFTVQGKNKPQIVGNIIVELRSVDTKKNRFTVALTMDDIRTEKKDRTINEPVIFYPRGSRQANELVVNSVAKDKIIGYLSTPKNPPAKSASASSAKGTR
jgi:chromosome segregation ATPase